MRQDMLTSLGPPTTQPEAVIREARRRQRRRQLVIGLAVVAVLAGAAGVVAGTQSPGQPRRASQPRPTPAPTAGRLELPGPIPHSAGTTVLMWPVGHPAFGPNFGPSAYLDNLATGHLSLHNKPDFAGGDFRPYLVRAGGWLVYAGNGTMAIRDDLQGKPRVLGSTPFFAPRPRPATSGWSVSAAAIWAMARPAYGRYPFAPGVAARWSCCPGGASCSREPMPACCWRCRRGRTLAWRCGVPAGR